jgi:tripartite-type tricarboxylate transporter receptor subunit TctC
MIQSRSAVETWDAVVAILLSRAGNASAQTPADFYKGKTISLIIASGEGGGYDISGRLAAEHLSKYIPGHPTVIARNMAGASGMRAADYMYNVAAPDGTVICLPQPTMLLNKVLDPSARYDPQTFSWIGRMSGPPSYGVVSRTAPVQSVEGAKQSPVIMAAAQGPGTGSNVILALNRLVGTRFSLVKGYTTVAESGLAMERGEVQGISSASWEFLDSKGWIKSKAIQFLYVVALRRDSRIPDTPAIGDLASNKADRDVLNMIAAASGLGRALLAPPNVPADRMEVLRSAFMAMTHDPDLVGEAERRNVALEPMNGTALQQLVAHAMDVTPEVAERARRTIRQ